MTAADFFSSTVFLWLVVSVMENRHTSVWSVFTSCHMFALCHTHARRMAGCDCRLLNLHPITKRIGSWWLTSSTNTKIPNRCGGKLDADDRGSRTPPECHRDFYQILKNPGFMEREGESMCAEINLQRGNPFKMNLLRQRSLFSVRVFYFTPKQD